MALIDQIAAVRADKAAAELRLKRIQRAESSSSYFRLFSVGRKI